MHLRHGIKTGINFLLTSNSYLSGINSVLQSIQNSAKRLFYLLHSLFGHIIIGSSSLILLIELSFPIYFLIFFDC